MSRSAPVLSVRDLSVEFRTGAGVVRAVNGVSFDLQAGETLGLVGESGSGKSVTAMSILGLLRSTPNTVVRGQIRLGDCDLLGLSERRLRAVRGSRIGMIFQDPMTSLNPAYTIGDQIAEAITVHRRGGRREARSRAVELLRTVGVADPEARVRQYPHEFSGGMRQRVMIAMAIANKPEVLVADEPTTALDVTIQAQVMDVLRLAQEETKTATILITHDLGLAAESADRAAVMYGGKIVEYGDTEELFVSPRHPYTRALLSSLPRARERAETLQVIPGEPPDPRRLPSGCAFHPRCAVSRGRTECRDVSPEPRPVPGTDRISACHFHEEMAYPQDFGRPGGEVSP